MSEKGGAAALPRPPPRCMLRLFQKLGRPVHRETRLFERIDNLFDGRFLIIEFYDRHVGELVDLHYICLCNVFDGPTDPLPGEGSGTVGQHELNDSLLGHRRRGADQDCEHNRNQHEQA